MNVHSSTVTAASRRIVLTSAVLLLGLLAVLIGRADASDGNGHPVPALLAAGSTDDRLVVKTRPHETSTVRTIRLDFQAGDTTGWHTHPGPGIVTIESGSFTLKREEKGGCTERPLTAGDVFLDDGTVHTLDAETAGAVYVTLITPADAGAPSAPADTPTC